MSIRACFTPSLAAPAAVRIEPFNSSADMKSVAICAEGLSNLACDAANHMRVLQSDGVIDQLLRALRGVDETDPARGEMTQLYASVYMICTSSQLGSFFVTFIMEYKSLDSVLIVSDCDSSSSEYAYCTPPCCALSPIC